MNKCIVPGCKTNSIHESHVFVFEFPQEEALQKKWIAAIPSDFKVTEYTRVCELHFTESDIERSVKIISKETGKTITMSLDRPKLKANAIPSIFSNFPKDVSCAEALKEDPETKRKRIKRQHLEAATEESVESSKDSNSLTVKSQSQLEQNKCLINFPNGFDPVERNNVDSLTKGLTDEAVLSQQDAVLSQTTHLSCETLSCNHVPPEEVPDHEVVQKVHSNQIFITESTDDYHHALESSEAEKDKDDLSIKSCSLIVTSTNDEVITEATPAQTLEESMITLQLALEDRSTLIAFEDLATSLNRGSTAFKINKLDKKKPEESMEIAKALENVPKNRYKDVLPYDSSCVVLQEGSDGDYINASFVRMKLPPPRKPTEYIATQGPLPQTCNDFWQMVWEQKSGIIVMVTTLKERNRVKCHQYWPDLYQTESYDKFQVTCFSETTSTTGIMRDFLISNQKVSEERHVIQLQYINWPDHGVPEDSSDFLLFVQQLRHFRRDVGGIVIVHCSAGVGRTGVLILMETAMGYIDADEPIYPLEMVKEMRDQRVMMVQTMVQYRFICEALLKAFKDRCKMIENE